MAKTDWLNLLFPQENACHLCQRWTRQGILCERCEDDLRLQAIPPFRQAFYPSSGLQAVLSAWTHAATARKLVHHLKYEADLKVSQLLGEGMANALFQERRTLALRPVVLPVPLHVDRQRKRGYNQSAHLARELCLRTGLEMDEEILYRTKPTGSLVGLNRDERFHNMQGAFSVADPKRIRGRHVLLVDDVYTTGATTHACAHALLTSGAGSVSVVTACRA